MARNIERRHLTPGQRAQIVVSFNKRFEKGNIKAQQGEDSGVPNGTPKTREELAKEAGVGVRTIARASQVEKAGQAEKVIAGKKSAGEVIKDVRERENGCKARLRGILKEHHKLDSTTYDDEALAKDFDLYEARVRAIAEELVAKETEKAQGNWQKAWTKVRTAWFDYEELSKSVEWETFTAAVLEQTDMVFLTEDTFENPDNRLNSTDLELLANEQNSLTTLGCHIRNPSFWVRDLIPDLQEQPTEQTETEAPSLGEKTEALKLEIREYIPTWKQNTPDTVYATLFHLCDARFRIKHGIPRGRTPFFFEELDDLFPLMKANDLELADKVREILATDASGVKSAAIESESSAEDAEDHSERSLDDRMERCRSDLLNNHWLHNYSWEGLDILPFVQEYDVGAGIIDVMQKEIAAEYPRPAPEPLAGLNGKEKGSEKTLSDVLGGDRLAFITVCLRESKPTGISGKGKLNYITFDAEDDHMQSGIDISEIPEPLLVQLIAIAKESVAKEKS